MWRTVLCLNAEEGGWTRDDEDADVCIAHVPCEGHSGRGIVLQGNHASPKENFYHQLQLLTAKSTLTQAVRAVHRVLRLSTLWP